MICRAWLVVILVVLPGCQLVTNFVRPLRVDAAVVDGGPPDGGADAGL